VIVLLKPQGEVGVVRFSVFIRALYDAKFVLLGSMLIGAALSFGLSHLAHPIYAATARVMVVAEPEKHIFGDLEAGYVAQGRVQNYRSLLTSIGMMQRSIDEHNLAITASQLAADLSLASPSNTPLLRITTKGDTPQHAADYANAISGEFIAAARQLEKQGPISVRLVGEATPPSRPSSPHTALNTIYGSMSGLVIAGGVMLYVARRNPKLRHLAEVQSIRGLPVVGVVCVKRSFVEAGRRSAGRLESASGRGLGRIADRLIARQRAAGKGAIVVHALDDGLASLIAASVSRRRTEKSMVLTASTGRAQVAQDQEYGASSLHVGVLSDRTRWRTASEFAGELSQAEGDVWFVVVYD
jgi:capsular polysaccharide biosynthesis protein